MRAQEVPPPAIPGTLVSAPWLSSAADALVYERRREITDTLANLLISTVHRIGACAERKVTQELVGEFRKVAGRETLLFRLAEAAIARPDDTVRAVVYPVAGEKTLRNLVAEYSPPVPPTGAPCRPRCGPPSPGTTGAGITKRCCSTGKPQDA